MNRQFLHSVVSGLIAAGMMALSMASSFCQGQVEVPPPKEPILPRAPELSSWTISFRPDREKVWEETFEPKKQQGEKVAPKWARVLQPIEVTVTKDGTTYREVITWSNGTKSEKWIVDGLQLREIPQTGAIMRVDTASYGPEVSDYSTSDFEPVQWIGKDNYKGVKFAGGRPTYEFVVEDASRRLTRREVVHRGYTDTGDPVEPGKSVKATGFQSDKNVQVAYLDARTQLPIYVDDGAMARTYRFEVPAGPLVVPERFAIKFEEWKDLIRRKTAPRPHP